MRERTHRKSNLLGNAFYTLQFIRTEAETPEPSEPTVMEAYKKTNEVNPLNPYRFCADPTSVEYEGRLYVYGRTISRNSTRLEV